MITFFNNPYDKVSVNTLQFLFVNDCIPIVVPRTSPEDDKGLWISFLPTLVMTTDDYGAEYARVEDWKFITPDTFAWLRDNQSDIFAGRWPAVIPAGIIRKTGGTATIASMM